MTVCHDSHGIAPLISVRAFALMWQAPGLNTLGDRSHTRVAGMMRSTIQANTYFGTLGKWRRLAYVSGKGAPLAQAAITKHNNILTTSNKIA
jgi:hypothetical protein